MTVSKITSGKYKGGWGYSKLVNGKRLRSQSKDWTRAQAEAALAQRIQDEAIKVRKKGERTFEDGYRAYHESGGGLTKIYARLQERALQDFGDTLLIDIRSRHIREKAREWNPKPNQQRHYISLVRAVVNYAANEKGWGQAITVKMPKMPKPRETKPLTVDWITSFCETADSMGANHFHLAPMCMLMVLTGARVDEVTQIETSQIDWSATETYLPKTKTGGKMIGIPSALHPVLKKMDTTFRQIVATPGEVGKVHERRRKTIKEQSHLLFRAKDKNTVHRRWREVCEQAEIKRTTPHACRHTFATTALNLGYSPKDIIATGAWDDVSMLMRRYDHSILTADDIATCIWTGTTKEELLRSRDHSGNIFELVTQLAKKFG